MAIEHGKQENRVRVECPHGMKVDAAGLDPLDAEGSLMRIWVRTLLLACPRCRFDADGFMEGGPGA
jgi:hypothetical protein